MKTRLPMASSIIKKLIPTSVATGNQSSADPSGAKVKISGAETGAGAEAVDESPTSASSTQHHPWNSASSSKNPPISIISSSPSLSLSSQPTPLSFSATLKGFQNPFPSYFKSSNNNNVAPSVPPTTKNVIVPWLEDDDELAIDTPASDDTSSSAPISSAGASLYSRAWSYVSSLTTWLFRGGADVFHSQTSSIKTTGIRLKTVHEIEKIVIVGVHGWFPNKMLQRVVGEPIGTSPHFAAKMEAAVQRYFRDRNVDLNPSNIKVVSLEGGGKIFDRVNMLYHQLLEKAIHQIKEADLIIFSAHSQGSPVSALIMQRLISEQVINPSSQRTAILAMAGISHGPFPSLKNSVIIQYVETEQAKELFDFNDPAKDVSDSYMNAMKDILESGCRYIAIGSWYDQVVPLYSATIQGINHPNLYRALYIDEKDYQPDFLSHLLAFALKLRNRGLTDHGLCIHLSDALAGSIYGFGTQGHSALYEEDLTYMLGVKWALQALPTTGQTQTSILTHFHAPSKINPYYLPWIWAHVAMDQAIQQSQELKRELEMIKLLFLRWTPSASHLKDIKYRLEPIKSKL